MGELINLRQARKNRRRLEAEKQADKNRKKHGVSTRVRKNAAANKRSADKRLDGHKIGDDGETCP